MGLPVWPNSHVLYVENTAQVCQMHTNLLSEWRQTGWWEMGESLLGR